MTRTRPRRYRLGSLLALVALFATVLAFGTAPPTGATDVTPTGLTAFDLTSGFLRINAGEANEQFFDLSPGAGLPACSDGIDNNDAPPLNVGVDGLVDAFDVDDSLQTGTATGGSGTTLVDTTKSWTTNQWAGRSVWITAGPGVGQSKFIVSNTATTLTTNNTYPRTAFSPVPAAGSTYHISAADPECTGPTDNSELAPGFQPVEKVVVAATVNAAGALSIPKNVRTSEAQARTLGGIYFPPGYVPDAQAGMIAARFQPAPGANVNTPATGNINVETGLVTLDIAVRIKLEGGSGITDLGSGCYIPSGNNGIPLGFTTGTTSPPAPNQPITGSAYDRYTGAYTVVNNSFSVGGAGTCGLFGLGDSSINSSFGLPAAAGKNTASFTFRADPRLNYLMSPVSADAGPDQYAHFDELTTLDASGSTDLNGDPFSYSWTQTGGTPVVLTGADTANPTFTTGNVDDTLTFELTTPGSRDLYLCPELPELEEEEQLPEECETTTDTDEVTVFVSYNVVPVANAGPDQELSVGTLTTLDASGSTDANLDELAYSWTQTGGTPVVLSGGDTANPTFTTPAAGPDVLTFEVTVTDGFIGGVSTDSVTVDVISNQNPTANAGPDQTDRKTGQTVTLNGTGSSDPDGHALNYLWEQTGGHPVVLSDATAAQPTFVVPAAPDFVYPHDLTFKLTVTDNFGGADAVGDTVDVEVTATTPTVTSVTRDPSGTVFTGDLITLTANVNNPDGGDLSYSWSQASGRTTSLSANNVANPTYSLPTSGSNAAAVCTSGTGATSPTSANCPRFQVNVTNTTTGTGPSANVAQAAHGSSLPGRPIANAGPDDYIKVDGGEFTLDGTASSQAQGRPVTYQWTQTAGETVVLDDDTSAEPSFDAPSTEQTLTFSLVVTDPLNPIVTGNNQKTSLADTVNIRIVPNRVVADAGPDQVNRLAGQTVTLTADASTEPDQAPLFYQWEQISGVPVTLSDANAESPTFVAPPVTTPGGYVNIFQVTVTNGGEDEEDTDVDTVSISVVRSTPTVTVSRAPSGTVFTGDIITLTANITNPDGNDPGDYTYLWTQISGRTTPLSDNTAANPTYSLPTSGSNAAAVCTSGTGATSPTSANCPRYNVVVTKTNTGAASAAANLGTYGSTLPGRPTANAGSTQTATVGSTVQLTGSGTQAQNRPLEFAWTQTGGDPVVLAGADTATPTFTAPDENTSLTFQLITTDPLNPIVTGNNQKTSLPSSVTVNVQNPPEANAGPDQEVDSNQLVTLDGSASFDPDDDPLTYAWAQTSGPAVLLTGADTATPSFTAPVGPVALAFQLTVSDGLGGVDTDEVTVTVTAPEVDVSASTVFRASPDIHRASTRFFVDVTNLAPEIATVAAGDVTVNLTVNGDPVGGVTVLTTSRSIKPGLVGRFLVQWNHGLGLRADDSIVVESCVVYPGDQNPGNNCSAVSFPTDGVDLTAAVSGPDKIRRGDVGAKFRLRVTNNGTDRSIIWPDDTTITITVNGEPTVAPVTNLTRDKGRIIRIGRTASLRFRWEHAGTLQAGDLVEVTVCAPNVFDVNPGDNCATLTRTVL